MVQDDKDGHLKYKLGDWLNERCIKIFQYSLCFAVTLDILKMFRVSCCRCLDFRSGFIMIVVGDAMVMGLYGNDW
jgi:hypothetical protein